MIKQLRFLSKLDINVDKPPTLNGSKLGSKQSEKYTSERWTVLENKWLKGRAHLCKAPLLLKTKQLDLRMNE